MKVNLIQSKVLLDLEKEVGNELEVNERPPHYGLERFYVSFKKGESMEGGCLVSYLGNGNTVDEALKDYADKISCRRMAFNAYTSHRKEVQLPKIVHTKLVGY